MKREPKYRYVEYETPAAGNKGYIENIHTTRVLGWIGTDNIYTPDCDLDYGSNVGPIITDLSKIALIDVGAEAYVPPHAHSFEAVKEHIYKLTRENKQYTFTNIQSRFKGTTVRRIG